MILSLSNGLHAQDTVQSARISFIDTVYDFGSIRVDTDATFRFEFSNTGTEMLVVTEAQPSCSCLQVNWNRGPIMPGGKGWLDVTFHADEAGKFDKGIWVSSNAGGVQPAELRVRGLAFYPQKAKAKP